MDVGGLRASLAAVSPGLLALALAAFLAIPLLGGLRWWVVLRGLGEPAGLSAITTLFSAAMVAGQVLPSVAGDGLRVWLATRQGYPTRAAMHSVLLERLLMVLALLAIALATAPLLAERTHSPGPIWLSAELLVLGVCGLAALISADRLGDWATRGRLRTLVALAAPTRDLLASNWGARAFGICLLSNLNFTLAALLLAHALGLHVSLLDCLAIIPAVTLATTLPISLGGWGLREGVFVVLLGHVGVPSADALALSLLFGVGGMLSGVPGLLLWCVTRNHAARPGEGAANQQSRAVSRMAGIRP